MNSVETSPFTYNVCFKAFFFFKSSFAFNLQTANPHEPIMILVLENHNHVQKHHMVSCFEGSGFVGFDAFLRLCPQASCRTTSSVCRRASCCPKCPRWMTCSPGSGSCSCWPSPAWLCCPAPSSGASARAGSNWTLNLRTDWSRIRRCSDFLPYEWVCFSVLMPSAQKSKCIKSGDVSGKYLCPILERFSLLEPHGLQQESLRDGFKVFVNVFSLPHHATKAQFSVCI